jgi:hypothetical protein
MMAVRIGSVLEPARDDAGASAALRWANLTASYRKKKKFKNHKDTR